MDPQSRISVGIVTWNSASDIDVCLAAVRAQTWPSIELLVADNASTDGTRAVLEQLTADHERVYFDRNCGFAVAHNTLIARSRGAYYLSLNPDVRLEPDFVERLVTAIDAHAHVGSATGKLLRLGAPGSGLRASGGAGLRASGSKPAAPGSRLDTRCRGGSSEPMRQSPVAGGEAPIDQPPATSGQRPRVIDSTGIVMTRDQRHLDRGAGSADAGQYEHVEEVFGASGAAALYRRAMLEDVKVMGEYFDEDFFAYREDADLAWRARLLGWSCWYVPTALAYHRRRVTPERRANLPPELNRYSVRNRFLLRLKNQPLAHALRFLWPGLLRDVQVIGYVLLREWSSIPGLLDVVRLLPKTARKRREIMSRRSITASELARWFRRPADA